MVPGVEGGVTVHQPDGKQMSIHEAALGYERERVPLVVLAGQEYGTGSSRDWAAKGTRLLGVRAVRPVLGQPALDAAEHEVLDADVRECAAHHDLVVAATCAVLVVVGRLHAVRVEVFRGR